MKLEQVTPKIGLPIEKLIQYLDKLPDTEVRSVRELADESDSHSRNIVRRLYEQHEDELEPYNVMTRYRTCKGVWTHGRVFGNKKVIAGLKYTTKKGGK